MSNEHDCGERRCVINKYDGAFFTCARCSKKCYAECLEGKKEIIQLLTTIKQNNINCTPSKLQIKIRAMLNNESLFSFTCPQCKNEGSMYEMIARMKKDAETKLAIAIQNKDKEINSIVEKYNQMEQLNKEQEQKIRLLENEMKESEEMQVDIEKENENGEGETHMITKKLLKRMNEEMVMKINENLVIMNGDIEARIRVEFEKIQQTIQGQILVPEQERKRKKTANSLDKNDTPKPSTENREKDKQDKNKKLKPPKIHENDSKDVYEIHVSKFDKKTIEKDIESHIIEKTNLKNSELFKITKLMSKSDENDIKYVTFKISTLRNDVYGTIMDPRIWEPDFRAREFKQYAQKPITQNKSSKRSYMARKEYEETPRRKNENQNSLRRRAIFNKNRMENNGNMDERFRQNNFSQMRRTPRMINYSSVPKYQQHFPQNTANFQHYPQWINPNQIMFIPANQNQHPNFLYPIHQQNLTQQRTQQTSQQTQNNQ